MATLVARAGPPEDIGGPWGYQQLVAAIKTGRGAETNRDLAALS